MAQWIIYYWRDVPVEIAIGKGRNKIRRHLGKQFEQAVDQCAMQAGLKDSNAYMSQWRQSAPMESDVMGSDVMGGGDDLEKTADQILAKMQQQYDQAHLRRLIANGGDEPSSEDRGK